VRTRRLRAAELGGHRTGSSTAMRSPCPARTTLSALSACYKSSRLVSHWRPQHERHFTISLRPCRYKTRPIETTDRRRRLNDKSDLSYADDINAAARRARRTPPSSPIAQLSSARAWGTRASGDWPHRVSPRDNRRRPARPAPCPAER